MRMAVFRVVVSYSLVEIYQRFRDHSWLHHQGGTTTQTIDIFIFTTMRTSNPMKKECRCHFQTDQVSLVQKLTSCLSHLISFPFRYQLSAWTIFQLRALNLIIKFPHNL
jgi:hypothetical protein